ncbi:1-aminocyclopropane-1-carboxylate oxidase homolog 4-like [Actinidia eriantha]|uniref:1-aminocyclopropane-1-carboxylate oxidase homolog 4-like n=1 Tax=Actinidia eriantha TaxID=165200 RepID=UPI00258C2E49|nr:1-aminocyclopropane-1-carboxylate oxidase homolog 4-like [Actinidia eriantha]
MAAVTVPSDYNRMKELTDFDNSKSGVKGLSDSGITQIPKFFIHLPETLPTLKPNPSKIRIPMIDLSLIDSPEDRGNLVHQIRDAAKTWGFFHVINHGVPVSVLDETIDSVRSFHEQPPAARAERYVRSEQSGVMVASNIDLFRSAVASWHDFVHVWMSPEPSDPGRIPAGVAEWDGWAVGVAEAVAGLLAEGLGAEAGRLREAGLLVTRSVAGVYYPRCPEPELTLGLNPHTDPGVLTVLLENQAPGLQVRHGGEWVDVRPVPGSLIINIGDALQIISNGEYRSVEHRVLANALYEPRISVVEFFNMDKRDGSRRYGPLPELVTAERPALYRDFTVEEFHEIHYGKGLDCKSLVEKLML